jgi:hypothetical protein
MAQKGDNILCLSSHYAKTQFSYYKVKIVDIRKDRGDNPIQDSPVKESAIRLFSEPHDT